MFQETWRGRTCYFPGTVPPAAWAKHQDYQVSVTFCQESNISISSLPECGLSHGRSSTTQICLTHSLVITEKSNSEPAGGKYSHVHHNGRGGARTLKPFTSLHTFWACWLQCYETCLTLLFADVIAWASRTPLNRSVMSRSPNNKYL